MYDCCVARERLRIIMSSDHALAKRARRGHRGPPVMRGGGCDDHILSDGRLHLSRFPPAPKEQVRSIPGRIASEFALIAAIAKLCKMLFVIFPSLRLSAQYRLVLSV